MHQARWIRLRWFKKRPRVEGSRGDERTLVEDFLRAQLLSNLHAALSSAFPLFASPPATMASCDLSHPAIWEAFKDLSNGGPTDW